MSSDMIILRSRCQVMGESCASWQKVVGVKAGATRLSYIKDIPAKEARRILEEHGMVAVFQNEDGTVYDKPGEPFKRAGYKANGLRGRNK